MQLGSGEKFGDIVELEAQIEMINLQIMQCANMTDIKACKFCMIFSAIRECS